jgi:hypothetical protein
MDDQDPRPLEQLHHTAERLGAVICLTTDADFRANHRRIYTLETGATLSTLSVVQPNRTKGLDRWQRLNTGQILATHRLHPDDWLDTIAAALLEELAPLVHT